MLKLKQHLRSSLLGLSLTLIALFLSSILISTLFVIWNLGGNALLPAECGIVFGSAVHRGGVAGPGIERRVDTAVRLLKEGSLERLIFTGGTGDGMPASEALVMRNVALKKGADPEVLQIEESARSTWQNVKFAEAFTNNCDSVVGVSDRYHLARIRLTAWRLDTSLTLHPADRQANTLFELREIVSEAIKTLVYSVARFS